MNTFNLLLVLYAFNFFALLVDVPNSSVNFALDEDIKRHPTWIVWGVYWSVMLLLVAVPGLAAAVLLAFVWWRRWRMLSQVIHHQE